MNDREFIKMVIDSYLSYATDPHMATLNNTVANRLNDIADKLEKQGKVLKIIKEKNLFEPTHKYIIDYSNLYVNYSHMFRAYKLDISNKLTEEEFGLIREWKNEN